jgi:hypothetical protein
MTTIFNLYQPVDTVQHWLSFSVDIFHWLISVVGNPDGFPDEGFNYAPFSGTSIALNLK